MEMNRCPKFESCSANICPLDNEWFKRSDVRGEPVCFFMRESVKDGAHEVFERYGLSELFDTCRELNPPIVARWPRIGRELHRSTSNPLLLGRREMNSEWGFGSGSSPVADDD